MEPEFWRSRWDEGKIGFHAPDPHQDLEAFGDRWLGDGPRRVLVPLCGKSVDLWWLAERGHQVVGVELIPKAVDALFAERGVATEREIVGPYTLIRGGGVEVLVGDALRLPEASLAPFDRVWDRAALVALPPEMRAAYVASVQAVTAPSAAVLLNTFEYDPSVMQGPPFSVPEHEVLGHYEGWSFEVLALREEAPRAAPVGGPAPRFQSRTSLIRR
jgi:thiopurine S-methyltransferase